MKSLRWPLFGSLLDITVMHDACDAHSSLKPLFANSQSDTHPLASYIVTDPPRSRMLISCWAVDMYECECTENPIPDPLIIENLNGDPITIGVIVTALHPYLADMEGVIREVLNSKADLYFNGFLAIQRAKAQDPDREFQIHLKEDKGDTEDHWENQARAVRTQRENWPPKDERAKTIASIKQLLAGQAEMRARNRKAAPV